MPATDITQGDDIVRATEDYTEPVLEKSKYALRGAVHRSLRIVLCMSTTISYEWGYTDLAPAKDSAQKKTVRKKKVEDEVPPFKVSTHFLIPKHELLTREESQRVLQEFHSSPSQLPYILVTDPIAKEVGAKPGDFVRISRRSETAGASTYYRYVVES